MPITKQKKSKAPFLPLLWRWLGGGLLFILIACQNEIYTPKPRGYYRITLKDTTYQPFSEIAPFSFTYSATAFVENTDNPNKEDRKNDKDIWMNLVYPQLNAIVFITYKPLRYYELDSCINDARTLALKQIKKADDIQESTIWDTTNAIYGKIYEIIGNDAACPYQFWMTDKKNHFLRASLYFNSTPQNDSLAPIIDYLKNDMLHLIETFSWKK